MFNNLLSFWKGKDFLVQVFEEFRSMLDDTEFMFKAVCGRLLDNVEEPGLKQKIYDIDKKVNLLQKEIRKRIMEHLSLQPTVDVAACLVLMSVVKDAERLGDYCKNLYEVTELISAPVNRELFTNYFDDMDKDILNLFEQTEKAFIESDEDKARASWDYEKKIAKECDKIVKQLAQSELSVNEAVSLVLVARHFKRLAAHLVNIATSMILPLSDLDYFDERRIEQ
ncbi:MAG: PhoU domain-containing protein [Phycisphaerales bacterium]|jgi:phosphate uptake regulator